MNILGSIISKKGLIRLIYYTLTSSIDIIISIIDYILSI